MYRKFTCKGKCTHELLSLSLLSSVLYFDLHHSGGLEREKWRGREKQHRGLLESSPNPQMSEGLVLAAGTVATLSRAFVIPIAEVVLGVCLLYFWLCVHAKVGE